MLSRQVATCRDLSRQSIAPEEPAAATAIENGSTGEPDMTRQVATEACLLSWKIAVPHARSRDMDRQRQSTYIRHAPHDSCDLKHTTRRDRPRQNQPRQGRRRAMSRSLNDSSKLPARRGHSSRNGSRWPTMNATSCASRSIAKTRSSRAARARQGNQLSRARPPRDADPVARRCRRRDEPPTYTQ